MIRFEETRSFAEAMDRDDSLGRFREEFLFPKISNSEKPALYYTGNSLGLQPKKARQYIMEELEDWARLGVEGHIHARHPWLPYHEFVTEPMSRVVGAKSNEVVVMNTLSVNLHLMMVSFYRPAQKRYKILIEAGAFPSDQYAVASQARFHGYDPKEAILEIGPRAGESIIRDEDILSLLDKEGEKIALVLIGNSNYLTGQAFDFPAITAKGHEKGCIVGFDLAHGAGNLLLRLHDWGVDFATWCSYKYLNSGPGGLSGCFIHERHLGKENIPRFEGWWGHDKKSRFEMPHDFRPIPTAEAWQLSNPPIFQLAALRASLELFDQATMPALRAKSEKLTGFLEFLIGKLPSGFCTQITPREANRRGAQLSLRFHGTHKKHSRVFARELIDQGVVVDFREPDIVRFAPAPLYCSFMDVYRLFEILKEVSHDAA